MKLRVVAVGQRLPTWAQAACEDYAQRFPPDFKVERLALKTEPRVGKTTASVLQAESTRIRAAILQSSYVVALDERGRTLTTRALADKLTQWQMNHPSVTFIIGGPDGLASSVKAIANETLRLSDFTLPHALARVVLMEQLYRAWSVTANHPYHRD